jgi:hypothetical protein
MAVSRLAVFVLLALIVAVTLAMLLVPTHSWAAVPEWLWTQLTAPGPCACISPRA